MTERVLELAEQARRVALVTAVVQFRHALTLGRIAALFEQAPYGDDLATLTCEELLAADPNAALELRIGESTEDAVLRVFRARPQAWLSSGLFKRHLGLARWEAQRLLAELAERGELQRRGRTAGTRYRLAQSRLGGLAGQE